MVIDRQMAPVDPKDVAGSLSTIDSYIRYMAEMIEFSSGVTRRKLSNMGAEGMEEVLQAVTEINGEISSLSSTLSALSGKITSLETTVQSIDERVTELEGQ